VGERVMMGSEVPNHEAELGWDFRSHA
jgi:hypothetical protein